MSIKLGLIGNDISYSLSPRLHQYMWNLQKKRKVDAFFEQDFEYCVLDTKSTFSASLDSFSGLQVTQPWKPVLSGVFSGAPFGNTLFKNNESGSSWKLEDTDLPGMYAAMLQKNQNVRDAKSICVFGFGGLAKKFLLTCRDSFPLLERVHVVARRTKAARTWLEAKGLNFVEVTSWASAKNNCIYELVLQLSSAPHNGDPMSAFGSVFSQADLVFDACYSPCISYGHGSSNFVGGLHMLVAQAIKAWKLWHIPTEGLDVSRVVGELESS